MNPPIGLLSDSVYCEAARRMGLRFDAKCKGSQLSVNLDLN